MSRRFRAPLGRRLLVVLLAMAAVAASCSDDDGTATTTSAAGVEASTTTTVPDATAEAEAGEANVGDPYTPDSGATGYDVDHYDIALTYDPDDRTIEGTTTITATATQDLAAYSVDLVALEVEEALVDGAEVDVDVDGRDVTLTPDKPVADGDTFTTEITYGGAPEPVLSAGFETGWLTTPDGGAYVIGEADGAATWFPSNDHPSDKATFRIAVTAPRGWTVAANGTLVDRQRAGRQVTWTWEEDDPMATYLAVVAVDRFRMVEEETEDGLPIVSFYPWAQADELTRTFSDIGAMIEVFEELFGPYPFDEAGAIVVPVPLGLALETQTRSIFGIDVVAVEDFRSHELAHQWFGDAVTPERWGDIWLNEGFASYAELLWNESQGADVDEQAELRRDLLVELGDTEAILDPGPDRWFSEAVYVRGGLVLHALRRTIGDDAFFEVLQRWVADFGGGNATTDDFVALAEEESGEDLDRFFEDWLRGDEIPELP